MPAEPKENRTPGLSIIMFTAPLLMGGMMYAMTKQPYTLIMVAMSPVMMVGQYFSTRRGGKKSHKQQMAEYRQAKANAENRIRRAVDEERVRRRYDSPDPATVLLTALGPRTRLWERRARDKDKLVLRLGTNNQLATVQVKMLGKKDQNEEEELGSQAKPVLVDVPLTVPLREAGVIGIAGPQAWARGVARWLLGQAAALHSPRDLTLVLLTEEVAEPDWGWARWLPHCRPEGDEAVAMIGTTAETLGRRIAELASLVDQRMAQVRDNSNRLDLDGTMNYVVLLDGARALRSFPGMPQILSDGPKVGVYAICLDADERLLPEECNVVATADLTHPTRMAVRQAWGFREQGVLVEAVSPEWCERLARAICPVRDVSRDDSDATIPSSARLLDILRLEPPVPERILEGWAGGGRTTYAPIGISMDGPYGIDIRKDGPHGLIAGTTGAGKSELLQTIIGSLAVANRPDAMTFVLIDYKGGAAFKDCKLLPHTVGMVTDLDGHLTERALASLTAELKRREHQLGTLNAKDIEDYWAAAGPDDPPMPRLVLVIDEFASLKEELPDFVTGLVGIAQRGRSLGVHLLLATQRPGGSVSPEIRANTNLRIALRVTDATESSDVIDAPDAGRIPKSLPGRAYARTGFSALTAFQAGRVGGGRPKTSGDNNEPLVIPVRWDKIGEPLPRPRSSGPDDDLDTDLHALVEAINKATAMAEVPPQPSPWLEAMPALLPISELPVASRQGPSGVPQVPYGLEDRPADQAQVTALFDIENGSHLLVAGAPRSGRSTVLRTLAASIAMHVSTADVHLYGLDCGNAALVPLANLPHTGAVATRDQIDRVDRLINMLLREATRRQSMLAQYGYGDLAEQRANSPAAERLPYLILLLDRWEGFMSSFDDIDAGRITQNMLRLLREGPGVGIRAVIAGDRSVLMGRLASAVEDKLLLRMSDKTDYSMAGLRPKDMPDKVDPGRGFRGETGIEVQVALLSDDPAGPAQVARINEVATTTTERDRNVPRQLRPARVDVLPPRISYDEALELADGERPDMLSWALAGVGGDQLGPVGVDLAADGPGFVIGGPPRSGRSTALMTMARSLLEGGCPIVLITPRQSPVRQLAGEPGVLASLTGVNLTKDDFEQAVADQEGPYVVLVDDGEMLVNSPFEGTLEAFIREGRDLGRALIVAGTTGELGAGFRGYVVEARKSKSGILIRPENRMEGDLLGVKLPTSLIGAAPPGRGLLVVRGTFGPIQIPYTEGLY
jgi:DNA segregation ATPase FtsK/SpoIIIE, S-DNA-T family